MAKFEVERFLLQLSMPSRYAGYQQLIVVLDAIFEDPDRLSHINRLFQEVSAQFYTTQTSVRDNIETLIKVSWRKNPGLIQSISGYPLAAPPSVKQFLEISVNYLIRQ